MTTVKKWEVDYASWINLWKEVRKRTVEPTRHVSFVIYFVVAVIMFGGLGVWTELKTYWLFLPTENSLSPSLDALRTAVFTFFPALAGSAGMQLIWAENHGRSMRAFAFLIIFILFSIIFFVTPALIADARALMFGAFASLVALWTWWIANAKQPDLLDLDAPTGKRDTSGDLPGDLSEFKY